MGEGIRQEMNKPIWLAKRSIAVRMISDLSREGKWVEKETFQRKASYLYRIREYKAYRRTQKNKNIQSLLCGNSEKQLDTNYSAYKNNPTKQPTKQNQQSPHSLPGCFKSEDRPVIQNWPV